MTADPKENLPQLRVSDKPEAPRATFRMIGARRGGRGQSDQDSFRDLRLRRQDAPTRTSRNRPRLEPLQIESDRERGSRPALESRARQPPRARGECPSGLATS